jgi:hypothetical protein
MLQLSMCYPSIMLLIFMHAVIKMVVSMEKLHDTISSIIVEPFIYLLFKCEYNLSLSSVVFVHIT